MSCADSWYEPAFFVPSFKGMHLPGDSLGRNAAFLSHTVARMPKNLRFHVLRINLLADEGDAAGVWSALIDLFLVLQQEGVPLKKRLLDRCGELLGVEKTSFLRGHVERGLSNSGDLPLAPSSVLCLGLSGTNRLIRRRGQQQAAGRDPLVDAQEHIEYGQLDQAQSVLEDALRDDPQRVQLHLELLAIYRGKRDLDAFLAMFGSLPVDQNPVSDVWEEVAGFLQEDR
jgi:hypothetical protein